MQDRVRSLLPIAETDARNYRYSYHPNTARPHCDPSLLLTYPLTDIPYITSDLGSAGLLVTNDRNLSLPQLWSKRVFPIFRLNLLRSSYESRYSRLTE